MWTSIIFLLLAAGCYGGLSYWHFYGNYISHPFWYRGSWRRKYANPEDKDERPMPPDPPDTWYYRLFDIKYKERFPLSATALVFLTDGYHLVQWFMIKFLLAAITLDWRWYLALWAIWSLGFNVAFTYLKKRK